MPMNCLPIKKNEQNNMATLNYFTVREEDAQSRIDLFLADQCLELSRSRIQKLINSGLVLVNNQPVRPSHKLRVSDRVSVEVPEPEAPTVKPENIPLAIRYEDDDLLVIHKPRGMVVHPAVGHYSGTLVNALLYYCRDLSGIGGVLRPGIVHRLDRDTSGLLLIAKNDRTHIHLCNQMQDRTVLRNYTALVHGSLRTEAGKIEAPIGRHPHDRKKMAVVPQGRYACTYYQVSKAWPRFSLLTLTLDTGRTHQIRVHLKHIGHPVVGDPVYGRRQTDFGLNGQFLHAGQLAFTHPFSGKRISITEPLPAELQLVLDQFTDGTKA